MAAGVDGAVAKVVAGAGALRGSVGTVLGTIGEGGLVTAAGAATDVFLTNSRVRSSWNFDHSSGSSSLGQIGGICWR